MRETEGGGGGGERGGRKREREKEREMHCVISLLPIDHGASD